MRLKNEKPLVFQSCKLQNSKNFDSTRKYKFSMFPQSEEEISIK